MLDIDTTLAPVVNHTNIGATDGAWASEEDAERRRIDATDETVGNRLKQAAQGSRIEDDG